MLWLYCEFANAGRAPMSCTFMCDEDTIGHSRSGMAKLASIVGWSCDYHELTFVGLWPEGGHIERDSVMLTTWFDQDKFAMHPETGEPVRPPICHTAICKAAYENDVLRAFNRLFQSRGWVGETEAKRLIA